MKINSIFDKIRRFTSVEDKNELLKDLNLENAQEMGGMVLFIKHCKQKTNFFQ